MNNNAEAQVRSLKRLILAQLTFQQVIGACEFLLPHGSDEHEQFYGTFISGSGGRQHLRAG